MSARRVSALIVSDLAGLMLVLLAGCASRGPVESPFRVNGPPLTIRWRQSTLAGDVPSRAARSSVDGKLHPALVPIPGKAGWYRASTHWIVEVRGVPRGTEVRNPNDNAVYIVP
jgi:hypothetical protein